jgi:hypothetical protein
LLVVVAAPVGADPGTRHVVAQAAACELHVIKQVVAAELCASRILASFPWPDAAAGNAPAAQQVNTTANRLVHRRIAPSRTAVSSRHHSAAAAAGECAVTGFRTAPQAYAERM